MDKSIDISAKGIPIKKEESIADKATTDYEQTESTPVKEYFDSLSDAEKQELCVLAKDYEANKIEESSDEVDLKGMNPEMDEEEG